MNILDNLKQRGILNNITNEEKFLNSSHKAVYIGFDPTAKSLHLGNYVQISILKRFQKAGFKTFAVVGGATGMIGDPSGKSEERNLLDQKTLKENKKYIIKQLKSFDLNIIDNFDFYKDLNILDFLRDAGKLLNISYMLNKEIVKNRIESGISFTEFSYQLIQGWDFYKMYKDYGVNVQVGGSDQWGNITAGIEIIRKKIQNDNDAVGITTELLTTSSGKKFGKTENNALFLDKKITSPFEIYQYLLNSTDQDVEKLLKWLTFLSLEEIKEIMKKHSGNPKERVAQKALASEVIKNIYSEKELENITLVKDLLFGNKKIFDLTIDDIESLLDYLVVKESKTLNILELSVEIGAAKSKREGREFLASGAIEVNGKKIFNESDKLSKDLFEGKYSILKRGKKNFYIIKH